MECKFPSLCLISDYSLITYLHIFVYERAELSSIPVDCKYIIQLYIYFAISKNSFIEIKNLFY